MKTLRFTGNLYRWEIRFCLELIQLCLHHRDFLANRYVDPVDVRVLDHCTKKLANTPDNVITSVLLARQLFLGWQRRSMTPDVTPAIRARSTPSKFCHSPVTIADTETENPIENAEPVGNSRWDASVLALFPEQTWLLRRLPQTADFLMHL